jgi:hypothetical protein
MSDLPGSAMNALRMPYRSFSSAGWFCRLGRRADSRPVSVLMLSEQCMRPSRPRRLLPCDAQQARHALSGSACVASRVTPCLQRLDEAGEQRLHSARLAQRVDRSASLQPVEAASERAEHAAQARLGVGLDRLERSAGISGGALLRLLVALDQLRGCAGLADQRAQRKRAGGR